MFYSVVLFGEKKTRQFVYFGVLAAHDDEPNFMLKRCVAFAITELCQGFCVRIVCGVPGGAALASKAEQE